MRLSVRPPTLTAAILLFAQAAAGQTFDAIGTRAQGMGGAFVGVADDASAVYWNPGGLARGAYFSLLLDGGAADLTPDAERVAGERSGWILALSMPALGLSYYRLRDVAVRPLESSGGTFQFDSLVTHHGGVTLVQSLAEGIAVGVTAKLVRGVAATATATADRAEDLLDGWEALGRSGTRVDLDIGVMASGEVGSLGLAVRNASEPTFKTGEDTEFQLDRQIRAGGSVVLLPSWILAADADLTTTRGPMGSNRQVAIGTEARVARRLMARGGVRMNTAGDRGRTPAWSLGGSYALAASVLIDAQATAGSDETLRGWGVAGRIVF